MNGLIGVRHWKFPFIGSCPRNRRQVLLTSQADNSSHPNVNELIHNHLQLFFQKPDFEQEICQEV